MAKGIRSKSKRANRSLIRKNLTEPMMRERQNVMAAAIKKDLEEKNGSSLNGISQTLGAKAVVMKDDDDESEEEEEITLPHTTDRGKKDFNFLRRSNPKTKGSKPRSNPGKQLEWFK